MTLQEFLERDSQADPRERYFLEREWIFSVLQETEDPYQNHLLLVHSLGKEAWKVFRMHRQPLAVPWSREGMLRILRRFLLLSARSGTWNQRAVAEILQDTQIALLQRQLLTILACDYRQEQQTDLRGGDSLQRTLEFGVSAEILLGRIRGPFLLAGKEEWLFKIRDDLALEIQDPEKAARYIACFVFSASQKIHAAFQKDSLPQNLARFLWEAWPDRKKEYFEATASIESLCERNLTGNSCFA